MKPSKPRANQTQSTVMPTRIDVTALTPSPRSQCNPRITVGTKQTAYKLPEKIVISTISPGGFNAINAAVKATPTIAHRDQRTPSDPATFRNDPTTSRERTDPATSKTLSIDDIAAAVIATTRKSATKVGNTFASFTSIGTTRSVSLMPSNSIRAYKPTGKSEN